MGDAPTLRLVGGPTALISYGGLRLLTDPTFDPPGDYPRPGTNIVLRKLAGPRGGAAARRQRRGHGAGRRGNA
jgi:L-ascorbate metabolism protein UlaG (beta-lactamase superfamily)